MSFLAVEDHRIALEEIAKEEAEKYLSKSTTQKAVDIAKSYGKVLVASNIFAATMGYIMSSGQEGMLEALVQINMVATPLNVIVTEGLRAFVSKLERAVSPDQRMELWAKRLARELPTYIENLEESRTATALKMGASAGIRAALYAGIGYGIQKVTGLPMNEALLAVIAVATTTYDRTRQRDYALKIKQRVIDYARDHTDIIEERKGKPVDEIMLVSMIKYAQEHYSTLYPANTPDTKNKSRAQKVVANMLTSPKPNVDIIIRNCPTVEINFPQQRDEIANTYYFTISCLDRIAEVLQTKTKYTVSRPLETQLESGDGEYLFQIVPKSIGDHGLKIKLHSPNSVGIIPPIFASLYDRELRTGDLNPSLLKALK